MIRLRKTWSVILAVMLVITAFPAAVCAATTSGAASELRLARAEGTVGVVKSGGQKLSVKAGMRLYSGYKVTTQKKSYGYVSLDSAKAVLQKHKELQAYFILSADSGKYDIWCTPDFSKLLSDNE